MPFHASCFCMRLWQVISVLRPEAIGQGALGPILSRLADENIDFTSIRMLFPSAEHYERSRTFTTALVPGGYPIIVVGGRGHRAVDRWSEAVGPEDPFVAKRTDPCTLRARFGIDRKRNLMSCSRSAERNRRENQWYFSLPHDVELDEGSCAAALPAIPIAGATATATALPVPEPPTADAFGAGAGAGPAEAAAAALAGLADAANEAGAGGVGSPRRAPLHATVKRPADRRTAMAELDPEANQRRLAIDALRQRCQRMKAENRAEKVSL